MINLQTGDVVELKNGLFGKITFLRGDNNRVAFQLDTGESNKLSFQLDTDEVTWFTEEDIKCYNHKKYKYSIGEKVKLKMGAIERTIEAYSSSEDRYYVSGLEGTCGSAELKSLENKTGQLFYVSSAANKEYEMIFRKEEKKMINVLNLWKNYQINEVANWHKQEREIIYGNDERISELYKHLDAMDAIVYAAGYAEHGFRDSNDCNRYCTEESDKLLGDVATEADKKQDKICAIYNEIKTQLDACETYGQKQNILKVYGVLTPEGLVNKDVIF